MRSRLVDVAQEAGVSPKTVSNYINGYPFMTPETSEKVRVAIEKLGYVPNRMARNLRTGRTGFLALLVPDLNGPYFAELATRITRTAEERGFSVLIDQTGGDPERERNAVTRLGPESIDGLILSPLGMSGTELAALAKVPTVLLGEKAHPADVPYVGVDNVAAAAAATQHLIDRGRTRIAAIGRVRNRPGGTWVPRLEGFRRAMADAGLRVPASYVPEVRSLGRPESARAMEKLLRLRTPPDAVFCFTDPTAVGALAALNGHGVRVPDEIAVIGWDDTEEAAFSWPPLSTVAVDKARVADTAVDHLLRQLDDEPIEEPERFLDFTIVERASTIG